ncbi:DoxX family protein [Nocardia sp. NPDC051463]|uniref:DoxX family protein n=1 Tax=Nocardia sp. NPDC051463 TaxID=3154845 RepID=UPI00344E4FEB
MTITANAPATSTATTTGSNRVTTFVNAVAGETLPSRVRFTAFAVATGAVLTESVVGSYWDLARTQYVVDTFDDLQYPMYFATILGVSKLAAVAAAVVPGFPRLKEWAYAGLTFVYVGAAASHLAIGDPAPKWISPLVFAGLTFVSWSLRRPAQRDPESLPKVALRFEALVGRSGRTEQV